MNLKDFNKLPIEEARAALKKCCGAEQWVQGMMASFPFGSVGSMIKKVETVWYDECSSSDYLEAFTHHPMIGNLDQLKEKFANTASWSSEEQSSIGQAENQVLEELISFNKDYLDKFGFIFLICATGKPAKTMLEIGKARLKNEVANELKIAASEQHKIILIRLCNLIPEIKQHMSKSQITTHVLDTSKGIPGRGITVLLDFLEDKSWDNISVGQTDDDGRVSDLLPAGKKLDPGEYRLTFKTGKYFEDQGIETFFPEVVIQFKLGNDDHYHVPLLISPYTYSTYRGS